jgi:hypothetical protein
VDRMDIGSAIEQQGDNGAGGTHDRPVKRRATQLVTAIQERRIGVRISRMRSTSSLLAA